jgi:hypothetical protein
MADIHVAIKSYRRAATVTTTNWFPDATVWVPESQYSEYRKNNIKNLEAVPDECDGNCGRKSNAILDRSPCKWTLILDDDITAIKKFEGGTDHTLTPAQCMAFVEHAFDVANQMGVKLWGVNQNSDEMAYATFRPFNLLAPILGPFNGHLEPVLRYDERCAGKDDYDFWLQNIRKYHRTLRFNAYHYKHDHGRKPGGWVSVRTMDVERHYIEQMRKKWGDKVFKVGGSPGANRNRKVNPEGNILNSRVTVPIAGC